MDIVKGVTAIDNQAATYAPIVIVGVQAAEAAGATATGEQKKNAVVQSILEGIQAGAKVGETVNVPQVAAISGLVDICVSIFNALGGFQHKSPVHP